MIRILQWLFVGHVHKWKTLETRNVVDKRGDKLGVAYIQQCEHCGTVKRTDLT